MAKNSFQDIIPGPKKSIRDIPVSPKKIPLKVSQPITPIEPKESVYIPPKEPEKIYKIPELNEEERKEEELSHQNEHMQESLQTNRKGGSGFKYFIIVLVVLVIGAGIYFFGSAFSGATIKLTPKTSTKSIDMDVTAYKDATSTLAYNIITLSKEGSATVTGTSSSKVERKASGTITISNTFSPAPQELVATTRFESSKGQIYRIATGITVPGTKIVNGAVTPGTIDVTVYADQAGDSYNLSSDRFTIPGFKSDAARYAAFYAVSKGALSGGFIGTALSVSDSARQAAQASIKAQLTADLTTEAKSQTPDDFILFDDGIFIKAENLTDATPAVGGEQNSLVIKQKAVLYAVVFNKEQLGTYLEGSSTAPMNISNISSLSFTINDKTKFDPLTSPSVTFHIKGNPLFVGALNQDSIKQDLAGKKKADITSFIAANYPSVERAEVIVKPFWSQTLPTNADKITIDILSNNQ